MTSEPQALQPINAQTGVFDVEFFARRLPRPKLGQQTHEYLKEAVLPACRTDFLTAARPFRVFARTNSGSTTEALLPALLGLLDADLRRSAIENSRDFVFGSAPNQYSASRRSALQLAVQLVVSEQNHLAGTARPSMAQLELLLRSAAQLLFVDSVILALTDSDVTGLIKRFSKRSIEVQLRLAEHSFGIYDPFRFKTLYQNYSGGDDELIPALDAYVRGGTLPPLLNAVSKEMRSFPGIGFGMEEIFELAKLVLTAPNAGRQNLVGFLREDLVAQLKQRVSGNVDNLLSLLTLKGETPSAQKLSEPTGSRLLIAPLVAFRSDILLTTPQLILSSAIALLGNVIEGRLPEGSRPPPRSPLSKALDRWINHRTTTKFEALVREQIKSDGTPVVELRPPQHKFQIDAVKADLETHTLWVISIKDESSAFTSTQQRDRIERYFDVYVPRLREHCQYVEANIEKVLAELSIGFESVPTKQWIVKPLFVMRRAHPVMAVISRQEAIPIEIPVGNQNDA
jgi:hypothetical protein